MKRGRKDQLTGGSGDVNPQIITITAVQPGNDAPVVVRQPLPIPRLPTAPGRNLVIELLAVDYYRLTTSYNASTVSSWLVALTTSPSLKTSSLAALQDPQLLEAWYSQLVTPAGAVNEPFQVETDRWQDLTDQAGHGVLVASDFINVGFYTSATGAPNVCVLKLYYRWKDVSLTEYIGIVQSQQ